MRHFWVCLIGIIYVATANAGDPKTDTLNERDRFRAFVASTVLCANESDAAVGAKCIQSALKREPMSFKWITDPDRLELLFQASRMDSEASNFASKLRQLLKNHSDLLVGSLKKSLPRLADKNLEKTLVNVGAPVLGVIASDLKPSLLEQFVDEVNPEFFSKIHQELQTVLTNFQPKEIRAFSTLFGSLNSATENSAARVQQLTRGLIDDFLGSLTNQEKSKIIADFFNAPVDVADGEKLRPLLQNLDPVMQKIFQLFGRMIKNQTVEEAVSILQSSLTPYPFEVMKAVTEKRYGRPFDELFKDYDISTIRRATTGQVLFATHVASGERVALKVRIPSIMEDFKRSKARLLGLTSVKSNPGLAQFVSGLLDVIEVELDYKNEAEFTDLAQSLYSDPGRRVIPARRNTAFKAESDVVVYAFASGTKPTKLTSVQDLKIRSTLIRNLIDLWVETVFFKNIESNDARFSLTTLFHGDLHPGNILIDPATELLTVLDFGNVGLFPLEERRKYIELYLASIESKPDQIVSLVRKMYSPRGMTETDLKEIEQIAAEVWKHQPESKRLDSFLSRSMDEVGLPIEKSISSFIRALAFLRIEANQIDSLLMVADPSGAIERVEFSTTMKRSLIRSLKKEFPRTLTGRPEEALVDRTLLKKAVNAFLRSRFVDPCVNVIKKVQGKGSA